MSVRQISRSHIGKQFHVSCQVSESNQFSMEADSVEVTVGQLVQRRGGSQMWDSVSVSAEQEPNGALIVRVLVFHPDWDEPMQIACLRSRPQDIDIRDRTVLRCDIGVVR